MAFPESLNKLLDALPRPRLAAFGREVPTFRTCGIAGFYVALIVLIGAGLMTRRSLLVLVVMAVVSGLSFFIYAYLRKWLTGNEELVLLEHVWFTLACIAGTLHLIHQPVLPYLDVAGVVLCPFLAAGRVGCTLVGCCHGNPSSFGITYNDACARDGFAQHLVGVRLFPAAAIEGVGLLMIGLTGLIALPFAAPGKVFAWYLLAYAIMRFGLEGIRGDPRPHFLGLSQARWMAIIEVGVAIGLVRPGQPFGVSLLFYPLTFGLLVGILAIRWQLDWRRRLLSSSHLRELCELVRNEMKSRVLDPFTPLKSFATSRRVAVVVSAVAESMKAAHVSLSLPEGRFDLPLLCEMAARAFPQLRGDSGLCGGSGVLHVLVSSPPVADGSHADNRKDVARILYGHVVRQLQTGNVVALHEPPGPPIELPAVSFAAEHAHRSSQFWPFQVVRREGRG